MSKALRHEVDLHAEAAHVDVVALGGWLQIRHDDPAIELAAIVAVDAAAEAAGGTFTKNDVNFLRSLRISVEGEDNDELTEGGDEAQAG